MCTISSELGVGNETVGEFVGLVPGVPRMTRERKSDASTASSGTTLNTRQSCWSVEGITVAFGPVSPLPEDYMRRINKSS